MSNITLDVSSLNIATQRSYGFDIYDWNVNRGYGDDGLPLKLIAQPRKIKKQYLPSPIERAARYLNSYVVYALKTRNLDIKKVKLIIRNSIEGEFYNLFIYTSEKIKFEDYVTIKPVESLKKKEPRKPYKSEMENECPHSSKIDRVRSKTIP